MAQKIKVKLIKSPITYSKKHKATLVGLGLKRMNQEKILQNTPSIRGMIAKVQYLVEVESVA